jgi:protein-tyrosine phosphatase
MSIAERISRASRTLIASLALVLLAACADAPRPILEDPTSGFALYRSGRLSPTDLGFLCEIGVEEILVLDGDGENRECAFQDKLCPGLTVRYNHAQNPDSPVTIDFLDAFDAWIADARTQGKKVAFRCRHGWHRTGRLVAYYRIRFEGVAATEAIKEMQDIGHMMWRHPTLNSQVEAYEDIVAGRPCASGPESCPLEQPDGGLLHGLFPHDSCDTRGTSGTSNEQNM